MNLKPFQHRVVREKDDLDNRLHRLRTFIAGPVFQSREVGTAERQRLLEQVNLMTRLSELLGRRIAAFVEVAPDESNRVDIARIRTIVRSAVHDGDLTPHGKPDESHSMWARFDHDGDALRALPLEGLRAHLVEADDGDRSPGAGWVSVAVLLEDAP